MSLIGKYTENNTETELKSGYTTPAVLKNNEDLTLQKAVVASTAIHITLPMLIGLISLILAL